MSGENATIMAYGQTSSGKTYTMMGGSKKGNTGINILVVEDVFNIIAKYSGSKQISLHLSYFEIYNEEIFDLLAPAEKRSNNPKSLRLRESKNRGIYIDGLQIKEIKSKLDVLELIYLGERLRHVGYTKMNRESSRSHTILSLRAKFVDKLGPGQAVLNLVDLAGSERASVHSWEKQSTSTKALKKEGGYINKSLYFLGNVIIKLSSSSSSSSSSSGSNSSGAQLHIPYRDSKLTRILQESLGGNAKTIIICCITPASTHYPETVSTLKFAGMARKIVNTLRDNHDYGARPPKLTFQSKSARMKRFHEDALLTLQIAWSTGSSTVRRDTANTVQRLLHLMDKSENDRLQQFTVIESMSARMKECGVQLEQNLKTIRILEASKKQSEQSLKQKNEQISEMEAKVRKGEVVHLSLESAIATKERIIEELNSSLQSTKEEQEVRLMEASVQLKEHVKQAAIEHRQKDFLLEEANKKISEKDKVLAEKEKELIEREIVAQKKGRETLEEAINKMSKDKDASVAAAVLQRQTLESELSMKALIVADLTAKIKSLETKSESDKSVIEQKDQLLGNLQAQLSNKSGEIEKIKASLRDKDSTLQELQERLTKAMAKTEHLDSAENRIKSLSEELKKVTARENKLMDSSTRSSRQASLLEIKLAAQKRENESNHDLVRELRNELKEQRRRTLEATATMQKLERQVVKLEVDVSAKSEELGEMGKRNGELQIELEQANEKARKVWADANQVEAKATKLKYNVEYLGKNKQALIQKLSKTKEASRRLESDLQAARHQLTENEADVMGKELQLGDKLADALEQIQELQSELKAANESLLAKDNIILKNCEVIRNNLNNMRTITPSPASKRFTRTPILEYYHRRDQQLLPAKAMIKRSTSMATLTASSHSNPSSSSSHPFPSIMLKKSSSSAFLTVSSKEGKMGNNDEEEEEEEDGIISVLKNDVAVDEHDNTPLLLNNDVADVVKLGGGVEIERRGDIDYYSLQQQQQYQRDGGDDGRRGGRRSQLHGHDDRYEAKEEEKEKKNEKEQKEDEEKEEEENTTEGLIYSVDDHHHNHHNNNNHDDEAEATTGEDATLSKQQQQQFGSSSSSSFSHSGSRSLSRRLTEMVDRNKLECSKKMVIEAKQEATKRTKELEQLLVERDLTISQAKSDFNNHYGRLVEQQQQNQDVDQKQLRRNDDEKAAAAAAAALKTTWETLQM
mmetsp:Transcript_31390/g.53088  ORF Transcript_31390/g.53088 Transcript_31390/m.53088 type:complete len:1206 (+) Transcript_31390:478-4095(+)